MIMGADRTILLISDRPGGNPELARKLGSVFSCRTISLQDDDRAVANVAAIVVDVGFQDPAGIERLRRILSHRRGSDAPIVAILRNKSRLAQVQAVALGATSIVDADASIVAAVVRALGLAIPPADLAARMSPEQNVEQAKLMFTEMFDAAMRGGPIRAADVEHGTASVVAAISQAGIRKWLEVVWSYHDATYQHCMLVTGLAAEFAAGLKFSPTDRHHVSKGALLHDIGKAKIPLAILNKPGALTAEETATMRTHPVVGYELLRQQGDCEPEILEVVLRHHEFLDGSGYPDGRSGSRIPDLVRLVTICDIYAALVERRSYKRPMEPIQAFKIIESMEGKLEGVLVRAFAPVAERSSIAVAHDHSAGAQPMASAQ
jgi:putative nucleotidyltransferase with HDIG domain